MTVTSYRDRKKAQVERTERKKKDNNAINNSVFIAIKTGKKEEQPSSPQKMLADSGKGVTILFQEDERSLNYSRWIKTYIFLIYHYR